MLLKGKPSDILLDYTDGKYNLFEDQDGELFFVDAEDNEWDLSEEVLFYISLINTK